MAPLKPAGRHPICHVPSVYPWLKGHGSFEAQTDTAHVTSLGMYPWLKGHGSFEAIASGLSSIYRQKYPWLKGHGSFEAFAEGPFGPFALNVSMAERSWLL